MIKGEHILIAGPSGCGKSTLAALVGKEMNMPVLSLDDYFVRGAHISVAFTPGHNIRHWEDPRQYDGARLVADIAKLGRPVVAEGFVLLHYPEVIALGGMRVYLDVPFEVALQRRMARFPWRPSDEAFRKVGGWSTAKWVEPQAWLPDVMPIFGGTPEEIALRVTDEWWLRQRYASISS